MGIFIGGFIVGLFFMLSIVVITCCLSVGALKEQYTMEDALSQCKHHGLKGCENICCLNCSGKLNCPWACDGSSAMCGVKIKR